MSIDGDKVSVKSQVGSGNKSLLKFLTWLNVVLYRITGGRLLNKMEGCPVCLVTMTGHKSGKKKTIALMYTADGDHVLLVASLGGAPKNPAWYFNLKAQPEIEIQLGSIKSRMLARESNPEERASLWPKVVASYPSFA